jgi:hypothetical protein
VLARKEPTHSALMLASLTISHHLSISAFDRPRVRAVCTQLAKGHSSNGNEFYR